MRYKYKDEDKHENNIFYKGIVIRRRDLFENINYYNAYWSLQFIKVSIDNYLQQKINRNKRINKKFDLPNKFSVFLAFLYEKKNDKKIIEITEEDIEDYLFYLVKERAIKDPKAILGYVEKFYSYMIVWEEMNRNPVEHIYKSIKRKEYKTYGTNIITDKQIERAKEKLSEPIKMYLLFSLSTGAKFYQIKNLKWSDIDFEKRVVMIDETLYMNQEVSEILKNEMQRRILEKKNDFGYVFRSDTECYFEKDSPISMSTIGRWCNEIGTVMGIEKLRHLDLRHMAIRKLMLASGSAGMTSIILNHEYLNNGSIARKFINEDANNELLQEYKDMCDL